MTVSLVGFSSFGLSWTSRPFATQRSSETLLRWLEAGAKLTQNFRNTAVLRYLTHSVKESLDILN